jgi:ribosomal protein S16
VTDVERLDETRFLEVTGFFDPSERAPIKRESR